jgi:hypothetical protein
MAELPPATRDAIIKGAAWAEEHLDDENVLLGRAVLRWHGGRCAICGFAVSRLLLDHDHATARDRGLLCHSCNTSEGLGYGGIFERYRQRNPFSMWGVKSTHVDARTLEYAKPMPPTRADPNLMKGIREAWEARKASGQA